ncbi:MAG: type I-C CRISPR-associated endonuclease Cas1 [Oscillospiraceae bacterium]|nr:type I-C CRISPR-associated endonuclease Cas1 [Oscillospiraceae bacterium]
MKRLRNTLYINQPDRYLSLDGENVVVSCDGSEIGRVPLHNLEQIVTFGHAGTSPALMGKCAHDGISLVFMSRSGHFQARVEGEVRGNVLLRREQYRIADDAERSLLIARSSIAAKLFNSRWVLERMMRDHAPRIDIELFRQKSQYLQTAITNAENVPDADTLRGIEGEAASVYFSVFDDMLLQQKEDFRFTGRSRRPPLDRVNALLSFAYSLMTNQCASALEAVGLDPYVGFLHTDRPGRKSLALDMVEEFRAVYCDRFVLTLINKRYIQPEHLALREDGAVLLTEQGRKVFLEHWQKRKYEELRHPYLNEKLEWGMLPYVQALLLARYIRSDLDAYPPFLWK